MKGPRCNRELKKIKVSTEGAKSKVLSYQCPKCDYFEFDQESAKNVVEELKGVTLKMGNIEHETQGHKTIQRPPGHVLQQGYRPKPMPKRRRTTQDLGP